MGRKFCTTPKPTLEIPNFKYKIPLHLDHSDKQQDESDDILKFIEEIVLITNINT